MSISHASSFLSLASSASIAKKINPETVLRSTLIRRAQESAWIAEKRALSIVLLIIWDAEASICLQACVSQIEAARPCSCGVQAFKTQGQISALMVMHFLCTSLAHQ